MTPETASRHGHETVRPEPPPEFPAPAGFRVSAMEPEGPDRDVPVRVTHPDPALRVTLEPTAKTDGRWYRIALSFPPEGIVDVLMEIRWADGQLWQRLTAVERNSFAATVRSGGALERMTLHISGSGYLAAPLQFIVARVNGLTWLADVVGRARDVLRRRGAGVAWSAVHFARALLRRQALAINGVAPAAAGELPYDAWLRLFDELPERHRQRHEERLQSLRTRPLISCITTMPVLNEAAIARLAQGLSSQIYPCWELIVALPEQAADSIARALLSKGLGAGSFRAVVADADEGATLNALLHEARGEYLLRLPEGAVLRSHALLELAMTVALHPAAELVYSDEDVVDEGGRRRDPCFKPAWSPDFFAVRDYVGDLFLARRQTVRAIGGWRSIAADAIDRDLKLRLTDRVGPQTIVHLAKLLVSLAAGRGRVEPDERTSRERMLRDHVERRRSPAELVWPRNAAVPRLRYHVPAPPPLVSIVIPTRDRADLLGACLRSIRERTRYGSIEILVVDNGSVEDTTHRLLSRLRSERAARVLSIPGPFNYSALNNAAAREANGSMLALLNNDIEIIDQDWLDEMVSLAARPEIGCVGAKLLYPDGRVQHAGVYLGVGSPAIHAYRLSAPDTPGQLDRMRTVQNVSAVTAACLVVRTAVFQEVGGFDEHRLQVAYNDVDFCLRVRRAGYLNVWTPFAAMIHHEAASRGPNTSRAKARRFTDERSALYARWGAHLFRDPYYSPNLTIDREDFSVRIR